MTKARDIASAAPAPSTVSATEIGYLDGVTSAIQTQIDSKQAVVSGVDSTEIGYLNGVTSAIQTQIDSKIGSASAINPTIVDAKGDLLVGSAADTVARLAVGTNDYVLTADSAATNGVKWAAVSSGASFAGVRLYRNGYKTLANNTNTLLDWNTEEYDVGGYASSGSTITIPSGKAGYYFISTQTTFDPNTTGYRGLFIKKNGNTLMQSYIYTPPSGAYPYVAVNYVAYCAVGDTIETYAQQTSGGNLQVYLGQTDSFLLVSYLGA